MNNTHKPEWEEVPPPGTSKEKPTTEGKNALPEWVEKFDDLFCVPDEFGRAEICIFAKRPSTNYAQSDQVTIAEQVKAFIAHELEKARAEEREKREELLLSVNIPALVEKMKEEIQEHGEMHGEFCACNMEDPDECNCEEMEFWGSQIAHYMAQVNEWWATHAKEHQKKYCTKEGSKHITRMRRNRLGIPELTIEPSPTRDDRSDNPKQV